MDFNDVPDFDEEYSRLNNILRFPRETLTAMIEDGTFQDIIERLPEGFWDAWPVDHQWYYQIPLEFSAAHLEGMKLILAKLKVNFFLIWGVLGVLNENDFANFDHEACSILMDSVTKATIKNVSFDLHCPSSYEKALDDGIKHFIQENEFVESLSFYGKDKTGIPVPGPDEEPKMDEDGRYSSLIQTIMATVNLCGTNESLKEIKFHWISIHISRQQFLGILSRMPGGTAHFNGGRLDLIDDGKPMRKLESNCSIRDLTMEEMYFPTEVLSSLPNMLACCVNLESLSITFDSRWTNAEANKQALVEIIKTAKVPNLRLELTLDDDYIEDIFNALRVNKTIKKLCLCLGLGVITWWSDRNGEFRLESPHANDWLGYNLFRLMSKVLEESNTTLIEFNSYAGYESSRYNQQEFDKVRYWTALNRYGREQIRDGSHKIADILSNAQDEMAKESDSPFGIDDFASVAYGLLKENVAIHGDLRSSSNHLRRVKRKTMSAGN